MNPKYAKGLPEQLRGWACKICEVGTLGGIRDLDLSYPSAYQIRNRKPQTLKASDFKNYTEGTQIP